MLGKLFLLSLVCFFSLNFLSTINAETNLIADEIQSLKVTNKDPRMINFSVSLTEDHNYTSARLFYFLPNPSLNKSATRGDLNGIQSKFNNFYVDFDTNKGITGSRFIPTGVTFEYYWEFTDVNKNNYKTEMQQYLFLDGQYEWKLLTADNIFFYYYGNYNKNIQNCFLESLSVVKDGSDLLAIKVSYPINIIYYLSPSDSRYAKPTRSIVMDSMTVLGGVKYTSNVVHSYDQDCGVVKHEVTHILNEIAGRGTLLKLPFWVDEGFATYMMNKSDYYDNIIEKMINKNTVIRLSSMQGKPGTPEKVNLYYAQSYATTKYIIEQYGLEKYRSFFKILKEDFVIDEALQTVYGHDQDSLYLEWRQHKGLPIIKLVKIEQSSIPIPVATITPLNFPSKTTVNQQEVENNFSKQNNSNELAVSNFEIFINNYIFIIVGAILLLIMIKISIFLWKK
jgi:hypothetical protein